MRELLFETPWWLPTIMAGVGFYLLWDGNRRQDKTLRTVGVGILLLTVTLMLTSWLVETPREKVIRQTRELTAAVDHRDWDKFRSLLAPQTSFAIYNNRDELVAGAKDTADRIGLKGVHVLSLDAKQTDTVIAVDLTVLSDQDASLGYSTTTHWRLDWEDTGNGWYLQDITPVSGGTVDAGQVLSRLVR